MLIDMHTHTAGISRCCRVPAAEILFHARSAGIDGIVLTNHYQKVYVDADGPAALAKRYVEEYEYTKELGEELGIKVFYGMEVTMERHGGAHILLYGIDPSFTLAHPEVYELTLAELRALVKDAGGMLVQAHPLRNGKNALQDVTLLDGIELSSHQLYDGPRLDDLEPIARKAGLILTSGGDFHADTFRPRCGAWLPDGITDTHSLCRHLLQTKVIELEIQQPWEPASRRITYTR